MGEHLRNHNHYYPVCMYVYNMQTLVAGDMALQLREWCGLHEYRYMHTIYVVLWM